MDTEALIRPEDIQIGIEALDSLLKVISNPPMLRA